MASASKWVFGGLRNVDDRMLCSRRLLSGPAFSLKLLTSTRGMSICDAFDFPVLLLIQIPGSLRLGFHTVASERGIS